MTISVVCQVEGWVVRKSPFCEKCYWFEPGSEKESESPELPCGCQDGHPMRSLRQSDARDFPTSQKDGAPAR